MAQHGPSAEIRITKNYMSASKLQKITYHNDFNCRKVFHKPGVLVVNFTTSRLLTLPHLWFIILIVHEYKIYPWTSAHKNKHYQP